MPTNYRLGSRDRSTSAMIYSDNLEGPECPGHELPEVEIKVSGTVEAYVPARRSGCPDNWSPAEGGGVEDITATVDGVVWELSANEQDRAEEAISEVAMDPADDYDGPAADGGDGDYEGIYA